MKVRYLYKLRPGAEARKHLRAEHSRCRWLWNECVHQYRSRQKPTPAKLDKLLTAARKEAPWLAEGSSVVQQQTIRDYGKALNDSFAVKGKRRPRYKSRKKDPYVSLAYTRRGFSIRDERLILAGGVSVPVVWSRELPAEATSVRVYEDASGWWWASFVVDVAEGEALEPTGREVGIDWGIKTTATTTDPNFDLDYRPVAAKHAKNLARYQRRMARHKAKRTEDQARAYEKAKRKAARAHRKATWERREHARVWASKLGRNFDRIAVEDFKPKFMAKNKHLARKAHDAAIGKLRSELAYQAKKTGRTLIEVPAPYTTMTCSNCGTRAKSPLPLQRRVFECSACSYVEDRDRNAARNVLQWAGINPTRDDGSESESASVDSAA